MATATLSRSIIQTVAPKNQASRRPTLLVDLDGVLVPQQFVRSVPHKIARYAVEHLGYAVDRAEHQCLAEYLQYGTNLEAFSMHHGASIDPEEYHAFIHGHLPYHTLPKAPRALREALSKYQCILFTNSDFTHSANCLHALGLDDIFSDIACFETMQAYAHDALPGKYVIKPKDTAMHAALHMAGVPRSEIVFFDDCMRNIHMGLRNNVRSVFVSPRFDAAVASSVSGYISDFRHFEHVL